MRTNVLDAIVASSRRSASERSRRVTPAAVERLAAANMEARPEAFRRALAQPGVRIIAECKRRSPSRGILRRSYVPEAIARDYARAGAAAISVLTEPAFFDGHLDHLRAVRAAVDVPVLRKDFIVTRYQIAEARAAGADAVLLIVAALDDRTLASLLADAAAFGLAALVETHDVTEVQRAVDAGAAIIGVNSRNLRTLEMNPAVFETAADRLPDAVTAVAESGISTPADIQRLTSLGYDAFLMGERFMTAPDPGAAVADVLRSSVS